MGVPQTDTMQASLKFTLSPEVGLLAPLQPAQLQLRVLCNAFQITIAQCLLWNPLALAPEFM